MIDHDTAGRHVELMMMGNGRCRVSYGDDYQGRYVIVNYDDIRDYVIGLKPHADLVDLYNLAGDTVWRELWK